MDKPFCPQCEREFDPEFKMCPYDGAELIIRSEDTMSGEVFDGRYRVIHKIGEGGMGAVYKAQQISTGKNVAIKVVSKHLTENPATVRRFQREVKLQSKLEHPNIVTVIDFAKTNDGQYFFVMPFVEGKSLRRMILDDGKLSLNDFHDLASQICDGLEYAHRRGIIHRDIKGDNIAIAQMEHQRVVKILDFGLAKAIQQDGSLKTGTELTQQGRVLGTPAYMSPEQAKGEIDKVGKPSDIYSLGVILYQMLSGKLPFESDTPWGVMHKHISEPPVPLRQKRPEVPEVLERVILRCLEKDMDKRYPSALAVKRDLAKAASATVGARPAVPLQEMSGDITKDISPSQFETATQEEKPSPEPEVKRKLEKMGIQVEEDLTKDSRPSEFEAEIPEEKPKKSKAGIIAFVVIMLAVGVWLWPQEKDRPKTVSSSPSPVPEESSAPSTDEQRIAKISDLLREAGTDFEATRLTSPAGNNAYEKYREVLRLDSENITAKRGLEHIAGKYVSLAKEAMGTGKFDKAEGFLAKAEKVSPELSSIASARSRLSEVIAQAKAERERAEAKKRASANMVFVKGGCFDMGDTFGNGYSNEKPVHRVCLDDFKMGKYEVTQSQFQRVTGNNPSRFKGCSRCPVERVTWFEAKKYCEQVGKRLPTEAEWEYAARDRGKKVRCGTGDNNIGPDTANFDARPKYEESYSRSGKYREKTIPVGSFRPNGLGLYDMSGNVWEWVSDWYGKNYYKDSPERNPKGPSSGKSRVLRGGSWFSNPDTLRASNRDMYDPDNRYLYYGFRCAQ